jgi:hypothetical protein
MFIFLPKYDQYAQAYEKEHRLIPFLKKSQIGRADNYTQERVNHVAENGESDYDSES